MYRHQYIDYNGKKYILKRTIREQDLKPDYNQDILKQWTHSDTLLRKDGFLYCCELIQEAEIIGYDNQTANAI